MYIPTTLKKMSDCLDEGQLAVALIDEAVRSRWAYTPEERDAAVEFRRRLFDLIHSAICLDRRLSAALNEDGWRAEEAALAAFGELEIAEVIMSPYLRSAGEIMKRHNIQLTTENVNDEDEDIAIGPCSLLRKISFLKKMITETTGE